MRIFFFIYSNNICFERIMGGLLKSDSSYIQKVSLESNAGRILVIA